MIKPNTLVLAKDQYYSLDCYETQLNNNVLVVGSAGCGKTRHIVVPNILQAVGSYIISDPKGNLYKLYGNYLRKKGYTVKKIDFEKPDKSSHYNFFEYIRSEQDIIKLAHMLIFSETKKSSFADPYWDNSAEQLLSAIIALLVESRPKEEQNLACLIKCLAALQENENQPRKTAIDYMMDELERRNKNSFAVKQYRQFMVAPIKTKMCTVTTVLSKFGIYSTEEITKMTSKNDIDIASIGKKKTAVFVVVSDHERSMDMLANVFYSQAMSELCDYADHHCKNNKLPVDVRFILDDFATNCVICDFPRMISSIRSRGISTMLMIQAESQLADSYGKNSATIIANCDTYVYMGGNDIDTAYAVARRCDVPVKKILYMPIGTNWIFRRGQYPINAENINHEEFVDEKLR